MARTEITRPHHDRRSLRHAGDCTDGILIASFMLPVANVGRPRKTDMHRMESDPADRGDGASMGAAA